MVFAALRPVEEDAPAEAGRLPQAAAPTQAPAGLDPILLEDDPLPPGLGFLQPFLDPALLRRVALEAERTDAAPDIVLLNEGHLGSETYYRALALHLGLPFAEQPLRLAREATIDSVVRRGIAPLKVNRHGWRCLAAPRGKGLADFITLVRSWDPGRSRGLVVTTPERMDALVRVSHRPDLQRFASHGLPDWNHRLSARDGLSPLQTGILVAALVHVVFFLCLVPGLVVGLVQGLFALSFALLVGLRLIATAASPADEALGRNGDAAPIPDDALPPYSVVVPLYRETRVLPGLVEALDALDYPAAKLDLILMVESNDHETLARIEELRLPARYRTIVAPPGHPQTKPRALNVALPFARGAFLVVFDAEDQPEPEQLRDAVARFEAEPDLSCLQAKLSIDNGRDSWIAAVFALEYTALFDVINPGLAALGLPVPLGGTSNHFRTAVLRGLNGWDAWNVTEDVDLGIRLARFGHSVGSLGSSTFEEAPHTVHAWLKQRRRWLKGWIVTLATHGREPRRLARDLGFGGTLAVAALLVGTVLSCLLGPFSLAVAGTWVLSGDAFHPRSTLTALVGVLGLLLLAAGLLAVVLPTIVGLGRRRALGSAVWLAATPAYFVLLSVAAWGAAFEAARQPFSWSKTEHGRAKSRRRPG